MNRDGFEFDLVTQRFLNNRWETELGQKVLQSVVDSLKRGGDVRGVLDKYVLDHPENQDPYGHPIYPKDAMEEGRFWVLTQDDLRGIHLYSEDFSGKTTFAKKSLNYARFHSCNFEGANLEQTSLTAATFEKCNLKDTCIAMSGGYETRFIDCDLTNVCFTQTYLEDTDFSGSTLEGAYFELATLKNLTVNYATSFDKSLNRTWSTRTMPLEQVPDILRSIRIAYEKAEIWPLADEYLYFERSENRKAKLWDTLRTDFRLSTLRIWLTDWLWFVFAGYGVKPGRVLAIGILTAVLFALFYYFSGNPGPDSSFATSLYYSFTTFATLGYGDLHYIESQWVMRLISTFEALLGASLIAVFVAVMARKILRH